MSKELVYRRFHTLSGVIPVGLFLLFHLTANATVLQGPEAYNSTAFFLRRLPFVMVLEWMLIYIPLLFHGVYGIYIAVKSGYNAGQFPTGPNWRFVLQ